MSYRLAWIVGATLLTAINLGTLVANLSVKARADVAGMDARDLEADRDFQAAVDDIAADTAKRVIEDCHVDDDDISC